MDASEIYKALADIQRVRLLNLIEASPLCVCHLQTLLDAPQVKISKQLAYLKTLGLVEAERRGNWMIYRMAQPVPDLLTSNLQHLRDSKESSGRQLQVDTRARTQLLKQLAAPKSTCPKVLFNALCS
ncbi:MAG: metalloregulator ArsR/SmtB family transcription factor [Verrucomicrobia bacterium]|nr:metalloregulator ArsR/SmtB family transcription factor [Verrucomicrobiota bacterium]